MILKKHFWLILGSAFIFSCNAQDKNIKSSKQQFEIVSSHFCNCINENIDNVPNWAVALFDCDNKFLFTNNSDFKLLEYILRNEAPDKSMSQLIWESEQKAVLNSFQNCSSLKGKVSPSRFDTMMIAFYDLKIKEKRMNSPSVKRSDICDLFLNMITVKDNDTIKILFDDINIYNQSSKSLKDLSSQIRKCKDYSIFPEHDSNNNTDDYKLTILDNGKAVVQFYLKFKRNNPFARIIDFKLIPTDKIEFDYSQLAPPPPPPPIKG